MRASTLVLLAAAALTTSGCSREFTLPLPETRNDPGYAGDWRADVLGQRMTLRVGLFEPGETVSEGRILYGADVDWPMVCSLVPVGEGPLTLDCAITPESSDPICSFPNGNDPNIEIFESVPRIELAVSIGGVLRQGTEAACDGDTIVSWDPPDDYVFVPG